MTGWSLYALAQGFIPDHWVILSVEIALFVIDEVETEAIRAALVEQPAIDRVYQIELVDRDGVVHASVEKTIYVRRKTAQL